MTTDEAERDLKRGVHVTVTFEGVMDSRPARGIGRVRPIGKPGWIAVVPADAIEAEPDDD